MRRPAPRRPGRASRDRRWARPRPRLGSPLHLVLLACSFALAGYAGIRLLADDWLGVLLWFVGAALVHDLVLVPLYGAVDRAVVHGCGRRRDLVVYVRAPAVFSGLLLLVWFPLIGGRVSERYERFTGLPATGFAGRWLLLTAALFGCSALLLVARLRRETKQRPPADH